MHEGENFRLAARSIGAAQWGAALVEGAGLMIRLAPARVAGQ